ncbi:hypothetical protein [Agrobacterium sp. NPDC089420]|uniref:hypothetical protein n=1 Tax=Agrobacterium sp. NPDC089420 TaxID=3363918 RepID=UPI00384D8C3A
MQISDNRYSVYSSNSLAKSSSTMKQTSSGEQAQNTGPIFTDYSDPKNAIFQNLLKTASVQDNIKVNEDGTYSWNPNADGSASSTQEWLAMVMITEQNGLSSKDPGAMTPYSTGDLEKFRQLTGYNLIQAGGAYTVLDDYGNPVPSDDVAKVQAAWDMFDLAKGGQDVNGISGDLTVDNLRQAAEGLTQQKGANKAIWDTLFKMLDERLGPDALA